MHARFLSQNVVSMKCGNGTHDLKELKVGNKEGVLATSQVVPGDHTLYKIYTAPRVVATIHSIYIMVKEQK